MSDYHAQGAPHRLCRCALCRGVRDARLLERRAVVDERKRALAAERRQRPLSFLAAYCEMGSCGKVAKHFGVSRERARQLVKKGARIKELEARERVPEN